MHSGLGSTLPSAISGKVAAVVVSAGDDGDFAGVELLVRQVEAVARLGRGDGHTIPLVATALEAWSGGRPWFVALYLMALSLLGGVCILMLPEALKRPLGQAGETESLAVSDALAP
ncbi:hypothetical protein [Streptomyces sp. NPDC056689]|uniref:hypothetical protein n=1 Tax=unclassified Streptomyces TaxID=2593676 RepID=UPI003637847F